MSSRKRPKQQSKFSEKPRAGGKLLGQELVPDDPKRLKPIVQPLFRSSKLSDGARTWQVRPKSARLERES
jgi:hypothetical protein